MLKIKKSSKPGTLAYIPAVLISVAVIFLLSIVMALVASGSDDPTAKIGIYSLVAILISGAVSGFFISKIRGEGGVLYSLFVSLGVSAFIIIAALIASGGRISGGSFMNCACYAGVFTAFAYLGRRREKRHRHR